MKMEACSKTPSLIKKTAIHAIGLVAENYHGATLGNLIIAVDKESGEVSFIDPEENCIASIVIDEWIDKPKLPDEKIISILRQVMQHLDDENSFAPLEIYKPFTIYYTDADLKVIGEIILIGEDSTIQSDNDLLEKFDREFNSFLDKLLKE